MTKKSFAFISILGAFFSLSAMAANQYDTWAENQNTQASFIDLSTDRIKFTNSGTLTRFLGQVRTDFPNLTQINLAGQSLTLPAYQGLLASYPHLEIQGDTNRFNPAVITFLTNTATRVQVVQQEQEQKLQEMQQNQEYAPVEVVRIVEVPAQRSRCSTLRSYLPIATLTAIVAVFATTRYFELTTPKAYTFD